jgi:hypothetical protein
VERREREMGVPAKKEGVPKNDGGGQINLAWIFKVQ